MTSIFSELWNTFRYDNDIFSVEIYKVQEYVIFQIGTNNRKKLDVLKKSLEFGFFSNFQYPSSSGLIISKASPNLIKVFSVYSPYLIIQIMIVNILPVINASLRA